MAGKNDKPLIEDAIPEHLDGEWKKAVLDFVTWMRENKLQPAWSAGTAWRAKYKGRDICTVKLPSPPYRTSWGVTLILRHIDKYLEAIMSEGLQSIFLDRVVYCVYGSGQSGKGCNQNKPCAGGEVRTILGKEIKGVCHFSQSGSRFNFNYSSTRNSITDIWDPGETTINGIKRLLELEKTARNVKESPEDISKQEYVQTFEVFDKTLYDELKNTRPKIDAVADRCLEGEKLKSFLDFVAWLRANKLSPTASDWHSYKVSVKGKRICNIGGFGARSWTIQFYPDWLGAVNDFSDERLNEIVWANVIRCKDCEGCGPGSHRIILGKEFERVCQKGLEFWNPGTEEVECAKQLILAGRE